MLAYDCDGTYVEYHMNINRMILFIVRFQCLYNNHTMQSSIPEQSKILSQMYVQSTPLNYMYVRYTGGCALIVADGQLNIHEIMLPGQFDIPDKDVRDVNSCDDLYYIIKWMQKWAQSPVWRLIMSITAWGIGMALLQVAVLCMLSLEEPAIIERVPVWNHTAAEVAVHDLVDEDKSQYLHRLISNNVTIDKYVSLVRFISDNIDKHKGFGSVMVLAFAGCYILTGAITESRGVGMMINVLIACATGGGVGVVAFHSPYDLEHIVCATVFIVSGFLIHMLVAFTAPAIHRMRDYIILLLTAGAGIVFIVFFWIAETRGKVPRDGNQVRYWSISAIAEYCLYTGMVILNMLVGERICDHLCYTALMEAINGGTSNRTVFGLSMFRNPKHVYNMVDQSKVSI